MQQLLSFGYFGNPANNYYTGFTAGEWENIAIVRSTQFSSPGTISKFRVEVATAPGTGKSLTFTIVKNGVDTGVTITISDTAVSGVDSTHSVTFAAGDTGCIKCTGTGTPTYSYTHGSMIFTSTNTGESIISGVINCNTTTKMYCGMSNGRTNSSSASESDVIQYFPCPGKIKNLYITLYTDPGTNPDAYKFVFRLNGADSTLLKTIIADNTTGNDTAHEITVAAGDYGCLSAEPIDSPSASSIAAYGFTFVADVDGESICFGGGTGANASNSAVRYSFLNRNRGNFIGSTTESDVYQGSQTPAVYKKLYVNGSAAPGAGKSYNVLLRQNGSSTTLSATLADSAVAANDTTHSVTAADGDEINTMITPSGTPTAIRLTWSCVCYIGSSNIKTINGLAKASVKTINGLAIASVKTILGLQ